MPSQSLGHRPTPRFARWKPKCTEKKGESGRGRPQGHRERATNARSRTQTRAGWSNRARELMYFSFHLCPTLFWVLDSPASCYCSNRYELDDCGVSATLYLSQLKLLTHIRGQAAPQRPPFFVPTSTFKFQTATVDSFSKSQKQDFTNFLSEVRKISSLLRILK